MLHTGPLPDVWSPKKKLLPELKESKFFPTGLLFFFVSLPDVMASDLPRLQVSKRLWQSGQPGALLRRHPHHQERPRQPLLRRQLQVRGRGHRERRRRFLHRHTSDTGEGAAAPLARRLLVCFTCCSRISPFTAHVLFIYYLDKDKEFIAKATSQLQSLLGLFHNIAVQCKTCTDYKDHTIQINNSVTQCCFYHLTY